MGNQKRKKHKLVGIQTSNPMKIIKTWTPLHVTFNIALKQGELHTLPMSDLEGANENLLAIIQGSLIIEKYLKHIIAFHFFGTDKPQVAEFEDRILDTDWCSYGNKSRLAVNILAANAILAGKELTDFEDTLRAVGRWRNAFAHGTFEVVQDKVFLRYYRDQPRSEELTDALLTKIETLFKKAYADISRLHRKQKGELDSSEILDLLKF
jgi:hypothetical protein